jgi:hypothetical protein
MPSRFVGSPQKIADDMLERRDRYGLSYYVVSSDEMERLAPVIELLQEVAVAS